MRLRVHLLIASIFCIHIAHNAQAAGLVENITLGVLMKPYAGVNYNMATMPIKSDINPFKITETSTDHGHFGIHAGLRIHQYFGVQVGFSQMATQITATSAASLATKGILKMRHVSLDLMLYSPILDNDYLSIELVGMLGGGYLWQTKMQMTSILPQNTPKSTTAETTNIEGAHGLVPKIGMALQVGFLGMCAAHIGVNVLFFVPNTLVDMKTVVYFNAGVSFYLF